MCARLPGPAHWVNHTSVAEVPTLSSSMNSSSTCRSADSAAWRPSSEANTAKQSVAQSLRPINYPQPSDFEQPRGQRPNIVRLVVRWHNDRQLPALRLGRHGCRFGLFYLFSLIHLYKIKMANDSLRKLVCTAPPRRHFVLFPSSSHKEERGKQKLKQGFLRGKKRTSRETRKQQDHPRQSVKAANRASRSKQPIMKSVFH